MIIFIVDYMYIKQLYIYIFNYLSIHDYFLDFHHLFNIKF